MSSTRTSSWPRCAPGGVPRIGCCGSWVTRFRINLSVPLLLEYEDVLKRPDAGHPLSSEEVDDVLKFLCASAGLREIFYLWRPVLPDPKDDFVLELAVESGCDYVVTFNTRDFAGAGKFGVTAIKPREFLREIGEIS